MRRCLGLRCRFRDLANRLGHAVDSGPTVVRFRNRFLDQRGRVLPSAEETNANMTATIRAAPRTARKGDRRTPACEEAFVTSFSVNHGRVHGTRVLRLFPLVKAKEPCFANRHSPVTMIFGSCSVFRTGRFKCWPDVVVIYYENKWLKEVLF
jgi:hypothetical protein